MKQSTLTESRTDWARTSKAIVLLKNGCWVMSYILALKPSLSGKERFRQGHFRPKSHLLSCLSFSLMLIIKPITFPHPHGSIYCVVFFFAGMAGSEYLKPWCMKPSVSEGEPHHSISVSLIHFTHMLKRQAQIFYLKIHFFIKTYPESTEAQPLGG